jgi:hypothetical protein
MQRELILCGSELICRGNGTGAAYTGDVAQQAWARGAEGGEAAGEYEEYETDSEESESESE